MKRHPDKTEDKTLAKERRNSWRQGSVLPRAAAIELQVLPAGNDSGFAMVITHDCDCVADPERERYVEIISGSQVERLDGNNTHGKNPRKLHLELSRCGKLVELVISPKATVEKRVLLSHDPDSTWALSREEKRTLGRWLAARYNRAAFPNELVERLRVVEDDFRKAAKNHADKVIGIFLDFEPDGEIPNKDEPYAVGISVVHEGNKKDAVVSSGKLCDALSSIFAKAYRQARGNWKEIELVRCESIPDTEFTYFEATNTTAYKLDDLSLRRTPPGPLPL